MELGQRWKESSRWSNSNNAWFIMICYKYQSQDINRDSLLFGGRRSRCAFNMKMRFKSRVKTQDPSISILSNDNLSDPSNRHSSDSLSGFILLSVSLFCVSIYLSIYLPITTHLSILLSFFRSCLFLGGGGGATWHKICGETMLLQLSPGAKIQQGW